jgi:negative regulator of flagellin synthesis FlgM
MKLGPTTVVPVVTNAARPEKTGQAVGNASEKLAQDAQDVKTAAVTQAAVAAPPPTPATVTRLSSQLVQLRQSSPADIDLKKVESVRSAIDKGTFKVNPEAIADKMLANAEEMLKRGLN